ncbi:MAG: HD domain-containing protein [Anaerolineae bacterium]|nr:HD domain-containing protein [Anaerolineae bacterium]
MTENQKNLEALRILDRAVLGIKSLPEAVNATLNQAIDLLGVDAAIIRIINHDMQKFERVFEQKFLTHPVNQANFKTTEQHAMTAWREKRLVYIQKLIETETFASKSQQDSHRFKSYLANPLQFEGKVFGVLEVFSHKTLMPSREWLAFYESFTAECGLLLPGIIELDKITQDYNELTLSYDATLELLSKVLDLHEHQTGEVTKQAADLSVALANELGVDAWLLPHIRRGALLHDIGNISVPDSVLLKTGQLTSEEWETIRNHTIYAHDLLSNVRYLQPALELITHHHERWDGNGYPKGLKGKQIPVVARIFTVVDVWFSLISPRPYRPAWRKEDALNYIASQANLQFDPEIVEKFVNLEK